MEFYIQQGFIDYFFKQYDAEDSAHRNFRQLLKSNTGEITVDIKSIDDYKEASSFNPMLEMILDSGRIPNLKPNFPEYAKKQEFHEEGSSSKYLLLTESNNQIEADFGCFCIDTSQIPKIGFLFNLFTQLFSRRKKNLIDWSFLEVLRHPCNAMIITDNYILKDSNLMNENLIEILKMLLPKKLNCREFDLTVIGEDKLKGLPNVPSRYQALESILKSIFPYKINLTIIKREVHDRRIFTNYVMISSGNSFTHFQNKEVKHDTDLSFIPITYLKSDFIPYYQVANARSDGAWDTFKLRCADFRDISQQKNTPTQLGLMVQVCGNRKNRLLSQ